MKLDLHTFTVDNVKFTPGPACLTPTLEIDRQAIADLVLEDGEFRDLDIHLIRPGVGAAHPEPRRSLS